MDNKKLLISGLTVAGFLATSLIPRTATFAIAADDSSKQDKGSMKKGSCSGMKGEKKGSCSGMKGKKKGSCSGMKGEKKGSCSGMKGEKEEGK